MENRTAFSEKLREAVSAVLPVVLIVAILCLIWIPVQTDLLLAFLLGSVLLVVGMGLFSVGAEISMSQIGAYIGARITRSRKAGLILGVSFLLGLAITVAEPDLQVLARNVPGIPTGVLIAVVSAGVGLFLTVSMERILTGVALRWLLLGFYALVFLLAALADRDFLSVAFDAGGVTTGPMTVPFIMALGVGVASIRSDERAQQDSFGLVGLCSIGPVLAVLLLGLLGRSAPQGEEGRLIAAFGDSVALGRGYLAALPVNLGEVGLALLPILLIFVVFQVVSLRLRRRALVRILLGLVMTAGGLTLFLTGVNVGFSSLGYLLGQVLAQERWRYLLIPLSMLMGWFIINAEPAVQVLNRQVEELSAGAISSRAMGLSLSVAVSAAMGLSMVRAITGLSILWFVVPGYAVALVLSFFVPGTFTAIAFDSGGVASGPLTAAFMLPFAMGAVNALGGSVMKDAFGLVALVAMMPLITVQVMGVISALVSRRASVKAEPAPEAGEIIELWGA